MSDKVNKTSLKEAEIINKIADAIELSMKKGHISTLILLALKRGPSHGYNLMQVIHDGTDGEWSPTASSLYPHLASLTEKGLIEFKTESEGKRERKVYEITSKGKKTLDELINRQQNMRKSLLAMIISTIGLTEDIVPQELEDFFGPYLLEEKWFEKTNEEKLEILTRKKAVLFQIIEKLQNEANKIDKRLVKLRERKL